MKKSLAVLLALVMLMGTFYSVFGVMSFAGDAVIDNFKFAPFELKNVDGKSLTVDTLNMVIYGLASNTTKDGFFDYVDVDTDKYIVTPNTVDGSLYFGTGSQIIVKENKKKGALTWVFDVVVFGDINGDGVIDVLDAASTERIVNGNTVLDEEDDLAVIMAMDANEDGVIDVADYANAVDGALSGEVDQKQISFEEANASTTDVDYVVDKQSEEVTIVPMFNGAELDPEYDYDMIKDGVIENGYKIVEAVGKGLYSGRMYIKVPVVSPVYDTAVYVNDLIESAGISSVANVETNILEDGKEIYTLVLNTGADFNSLEVNTAALNGLLTNVKNIFHSNYADETIIVGGYTLAENGYTQNTNIKNFLFDFANFFLTDLQNIDETGIVRSYEGKLIGANENDFQLNLKLLPGRIDTIKKLAAKIQQYVKINMVNGIYDVTVTMPRSVTKKVVSALGNGDAAKANENFGNFTVGDAFYLLSELDASSLNSEYGPMLEKFAVLFTQFAEVVNKVLGNTSYFKVADKNNLVYGNVRRSGFEIIDRDEDEENVFGDCIWSAACMLDDNVSGTEISKFYDADGVYTIRFNIGLNVAAIKGSVILHLDIFDVED